MMKYSTLFLALTLSLGLAGCGQEEKTAEAPKEWKAYVPPVATGSALAGTGTAVVPKAGTGSVKN